MVLSESETVRLVHLLSPERLQALVMLTGSEASAIALHQQTLALGCDLLKAVATVEIALRNAVAANLQHHFGVSNWLIQPPIPFRWRSEDGKKISRALSSARRAEYAKLNQTAKAALDQQAFPEGRPAQLSHLQRSNARCKQIAVTEGKVIAELTFYFWKRLFGPEYEQSLWRPSLKRVFPRKTLRRAEIAVRLEAIYQARNRLAHHEPVLRQRFADTIQAIAFVAKELAADPDSEPALAKLLHDDFARITATEADLRQRLDAFRNDGRACTT